MTADEEAPDRAGRSAPRLLLPLANGPAVKVGPCAVAIGHPDAIPGDHETNIGPQRPQDTLAGTPIS